MRWISLAQIHSVFVHDDKTISLLRPMHSGAELLENLLGSKGNTARKYSVEEQILVDDVQWKEQRISINFSRKPFFSLSLHNFERNAFEKLFKINRNSQFAVSPFILTPIPQFAPERQHIVAPFDLRPGATVLLVDPAGSSGNLLFSVRLILFYKLAVR